MISLNIKKLKPGAIVPSYQTELSAGMDLCACIDTPITLQPMQRILVPCGFSLSIPRGCEVQIRARSGLALKNGITMANGIGTIDADYRGEIGVILINMGIEPFVINNGDRIAQMVLSRYEKVDFNIIEDLDITDRGMGGFGSTGK
jgi:dUTP pyrophosphatase